MIKLFCIAVAGALLAYAAPSMAATRDYSCTGGLHTDVWGFAATACNGKPDHPARQEKPTPPDTTPPDDDPDPDPGCKGRGCGGEHPGHGKGLTCSM